MKWMLYIILVEVSHCYVNVALNKPTYQQNPFKPNYSGGDASNAVDGQKSDLSRNGGQCVVSARSVTATWWVNLTSIHSIHHITIYYMTDNKPWGTTNYQTGLFLGFSVYVSNSTNRQQGTLCYKDNNFTLETIPAVVTVVCPVHGQYVIYYNERLTVKSYPESYKPYAENNLCEIEVYGCPVAGCYGSNNSFPCPDVNCHHCHKETGTCLVCKPGYKGQRCELRCNTGKYGINCSQSCGNCHNQSQCHKVDGSCSGGCAAGYKGRLCTDQCGIGKYGIECFETCGNCRNQSQCNNVNGYCSEGCSAGYKGSFCTELCDHSSYGINCSQTCSKNCSSQGCNHVNGDCIALQKTEHLSNFAHGIVAASICLVFLGITCIVVFKEKRKRKRKRKRIRYSTSQSFHHFNCIV